MTILVDKAIKKVIFSRLHMFKKIKRRINKISKWPEETEKSHINLSEKCWLDGIKNILDTAEEKDVELERRATETPYVNLEGEKKTKNNLTAHEGAVG
jgi:hypothetical protein